MSRIHPETETGLGWRHFNPQKTENTITRAINEMRRHPVATTVSVLLAAFTLGNLYLTEVFRRSTETPSDIPLSGEVTSQTEIKISIPGQEPGILSTEYIQTAWALLARKFETGDLSFLEQMQKEGRYVGEPIIFGPPRSGRVDETFKALGVRLVPSSDSERFPLVESMGGSISWIAEIVVINPDKSIEVFGLLAGRGEPGYIPLRSITPNGEVTWYIRPPTGFSAATREQFSGK